MKINRKTTALAVALGLGATMALTATTASAFGGRQGPRDMNGPMGAFMQMEFADIDLNKDGKITLEDLQAVGKARFDAADKDGNGELSADEVMAQAEERMAQRQANMPDAGNGAPAPRQPGGKFGQMTEKQRGWMAEEMISRRDTDKNGALSLEEVSPDTARLERMIDRFDTDDDNAISQAEFETAQKEMFLKSRHGRMGGKGDRKGFGPKGGRG